MIKQINVYPSKTDSDKTKFCTVYLDNGTIRTQNVGSYGFVMFVLANC